MYRSTCPALAAGIFLLACAPTNGRADIYRCVQDNGRISFQQTRCDMRSQPLRLDTAPSGWSALRPGERQLLEQYQRPAAPPAHHRPESRPRADANAKACWKARRQLQAVRAHLRRGYRLGEAPALRRKRDDYADYLEQFCD